MTSLFRFNFPDYVIILYIAELVSNYFPNYVMSCVVAKHTMSISDYIDQLCNLFLHYEIGVELIMS